MKKLLLIVLIFLSDIKTHNQWHVQQFIRTGNCPGCDLSGANFIGLNFKYANLDGANLTRTNFSGATLTNLYARSSTCVGTIFNQATIKTARFNKLYSDKPTNLNAAQFVNTYIEDGNFTDAILANANFYWARVPGAIFVNAKLANTVYKRSDLFRANFFGATGNLLVDTCGYGLGCQTGICSFDCTNFCCTTMPDGTVKTDPLNNRCSFVRRQACGG